MAETTLISPGVLARETDLSFIKTNPPAVGAAIVGPTLRGPVEIPTVVTSYSDFAARFGTTFTSGSSITSSTTVSYFTSIAAYNYFNNGGTSLLVVRVVSGSYSSATSSNNILSQIGSQPVFVLETLSEGAIMNNTGAEIGYGSLVSGSTQNIRYEITNANSSSGRFDLLVRRGDDSNTQKMVLETWTNLNLDPYSPNYIARRIGDLKPKYDSTTQQLQYSGSYLNNSVYVRVKSVNITTPNFFDNDGFAKSWFTGSIPTNASGTFGSAIGTPKSSSAYYNAISDTNTQGLEAGNYTQMINLLRNKDDFRYNVLVTPGLYYAASAHATQMDKIITNTEYRGDSIYVPDMDKYGSTKETVTGQAALINSSYAATYWPWVLVNDPDSGQFVWVPASTLIPGVYAYNDSVSEPWFAPAGINRGGMSGVVRVEQRLGQPDRDFLYTGKVNPIATFPAQGVVVYGQKTLQAKSSALDRVNVRRLMIAVKGYISNISNSLVFEQNTQATRYSFLAQVNPYLTSVQQRQGLYAFKVNMDDSLNGPEVIDRNELRGQIYLQPTKTAEFIYLDFYITPTGAEFPS